MRRVPRLALRSTLLVLGLALGSVASAQTIAVVNPSFEAPPLSDNTFVASPAGVGWTFSTTPFAGDSGIQNPADDSYTGATDQTPDPDTPVPDGRNTGFVNNGTLIRQVLADTYDTDATYTLSVHAGWRKQGFIHAPTFRIALLNGTDLSVLASQTVTLVTRDAFVPLSVEYVAQPAADGASIAIELLSLDGTDVFRQADFDAVALTRQAQVPALGAGARALLTALLGGLGIHRVGRAVARRAAAPAA